MLTFFSCCLADLLHGNSPLPDMESWLQKDQDDGSDQREFTSSLTGGDESFGSAHQTYQNSLIREKKSSDSENTLQTKDDSEFSSNSRIKRHEPILYGRNLKEKNEELEDKDKDEGTFDGFDSDTGSSPGANYFGALNQGFRNSENLNPRMKNKFARENEYVDIIPSLDLLRNSRISNFYKKPAHNLDAFDRNLNSRMLLQKRLKQRYASNPALYYPQSVSDENLNYPNQEDYLSADEEGRDREISDEYKNSIGSEDKSPQILDENEYYDAEVNPMLGEEDDYNQLLSNRRYIRKRDETSQAAPNDNKMGWNTFDQSQIFMNYQPAEMIPQDKTNPQYLGVQTRDVANAPGANYIWTLKDDTHSQELADLMKSSQRALQEVQLFQSKLPYKAPDASALGGYNRESPNPYGKFDPQNYLYDGTRLKREDEDEQKNMKTGTDEGGGEYEDEEGKGHKDEEEYYEDADLSGNNWKPEALASDEQKEKHVKREILKDANLKGTKNEGNEKSDDFELNLANAPVENEDKSKKSAYREGEKTNKNTARKGVKIWDQWGKWSACSVTCGVGRSTRWRHCIGGGCAQGEKEAQIKRCTNPAC